MTRASPPDAVVIAPERHLLDGGGAANVIGAQIRWLAANRFKAVLLVAAPHLNPFRDRRAQVTGIGRRLGADAVVTAGFDSDPRRLLQRIAASAHAVAGDHSLKADLALSAAMDTGAAESLGGARVAIVNYLSGLSLGEAIAARPRRILVAHDLPSASLDQNVADALARFSQVICLNAEEAEAARRAAPSASISSGLIWNPPELSAVAAGPPIDLLFVGGAHPPNVEGLRAFLDQCYAPYLSGAGVGFTVAGRSGEALRRDYAGMPGLNLMGRVDDVGALYACAKLVVAPLLSGTGVSIKCAEAISAGATLLATPAALRGLAPADAPALEPPFDARWAAEIKRLLGDSAGAGAWRGALATAFQRTAANNVFADAVTSICAEA